MRYNFSRRNQHKLNKRLKCILWRFKTELIPKESYYVLEDRFAQYVFSNAGGSLAEINLKLQSSKDPTIVVKPIYEDRYVQEVSPNNARFPLHEAYRVANGSKTLVKPQTGNYTPLLRRDLLSDTGAIETKVAPNHYAYALSHIDDEKTYTYQLVKQTATEITFSAQTKLGKIEKTFALTNSSAPYALTCNIKIENPSNGFKLFSGMIEADLISSSYSPLLQYLPYEEYISSADKISNPSTIEEFKETPYRWLSSSNGFFGLMQFPFEKTTSFESVMIEGEKAPTRMTLMDNGTKYTAKEFPSYGYLIPLKNRENSILSYLGPFDRTILKEADSATTYLTNGKSPHFDAVQTIYGWFAFITEPFGNFLTLLLEGFHTVTQSWGVSIILLTIALRLMMFPLNKWSMKSMMKMQHLQPQISIIQKKYKTDPKKLQQETMSFYKKNKINPVSGCLPHLLQMPFLFGMYEVLRTLFSLRGTAFIPGWINNLAAPDKLFSWGVSIPFLGNHFHLLPILVGLSMLLQQKIMMAKNPTSQNSAMGYMMTLVFTVIFYNLPSGLNLYWFFSTILAVAQQILTKRKMAGTENANLIN